MADQNDYKNRFKCLIELLHRSLECPVCLDILDGSFKICSRGHAVCFDCTKNLATCPTCEEEFTLDNIVCLKNVLEIVPKFCCYIDEGCEEIVDPDSEHETFCGFRLIPCTISECDVEVCIKDFRSHIEQVHLDEPIIKEEFASLSSSWNNNELYRTPVLLFNSLFWLIEKADKKTGQLNIIFGKTPIEKSCHEYYVKIKLEQGKFAYTHTLKAVLINDLHLLTDGYDDDYTPDEMRGVTGVHCMKIPLCELSRFKDSEGKITCKYTFFKDDSE